MIPRALPTFALFTLSVSLLSGQFRTFTNDWGDSVEAELLEFKEASCIVTLRLKNGRKIDSRVTAFSQTDQEYIHQWWADFIASKHVLRADARILISAKMNRKSRSNNYDNWYGIDDETKSFFPEIVIENKELQKYTGNTIRVVVFADDRHNRGQKLVVSASTLKSDLIDRGKTILEGEPFRLRLYEHDSTFTNYEYEFGYEYESFAVVIKNSDGQITHKRASKSKYLENLDIIFSCEAGEMYDESIKRKLSARPSSYFVR